MFDEKNNTQNNDNNENVDIELTSKEYCDTCSDNSETFCEQTEPTQQAENAEQAEQTQQTEGFDENIIYQKDNTANDTNCYEWNGDGQCMDKADEPAPSCKNQSAKTGKGFKVFIAAALSVFTISAVAMSAMVIGFVLNRDDVRVVTKSNSQKISDNIQSSENFNYNPITVDNKNFVAYSFEDREGQPLSIPEVAAKCTPSSVGIIAEVEVTYNYPFYFSPSTKVSTASGSGFVYSAEGYIITNHHVVENAKKITVVLYDGNQLEATLVGSDSLSDIAVLKVTPDEDTSLIPMEIGNSDEVVVGEQVVAIGCPAGIEFIGTVTDGIVSAINRNVEVTDSTGSVQKVMTLIQTNATINHGNSGGPLINNYGQVIGINTLKLASDYEGIGFSIPINGAVSIIKQLIDHGKVVERTEEDFATTKGMIGINGSAITEDEAEAFDIPMGVLVIQLDRESSAAKAGLRRGDIITQYNGKDVKTVEDINTHKGTAKAGETVTLTVFRDEGGNEGKTIKITFKLDPVVN